MLAVLLLSTCRATSVELRAKSEGQSARAKLEVQEQSHLRIERYSENEKSQTLPALGSLLLAPCLCSYLGLPIVTCLCKAIASGLSGLIPIALAAYFRASPRSPFSKKILPNRI